MKNNLIFTIFLAIFVFLSLPKFTYAYLDPGTGSYIFQLLIAGLIGSSFFLKTAVKKIRNKFKPQPQKETTDGDK
jgi:hypothetical protein